MKGHRTFVTVQGYTMSEAEVRYSPNGKAVASFPVGVGGNREKGVKGVVFRCVAWEDNAWKVQEVVDDKGLAVIVSGRLSQSTSQKNGTIYVNNNLNIDSLMLQGSKDATELKEVEIVRSWVGKKSAESEDSKD